MSRLLTNAKYSGLREETLADDQERLAPRATIQNSNEINRIEFTAMSEMSDPQDGWPEKPGLLMARWSE